MSVLKITEKLALRAPVERVFRFLLDPQKVASCLPGAQLDGVEGDNVFLGTMKVKVGPVTSEFKGRAVLCEVDEAGRRVTLSGDGRDKNGAGTARLTMQGAVRALPDGTTELSVEAEVQLAGRLVSFGRGMIQAVSAQLFKDFAERARRALEQPEAPPAGPPAPSPAEAAPAAPSPVPAPAGAPSPAPETPAAAPQVPSPAPQAAPAPQVPSPAQEGPASPGAAPLAAAPVQPVNGLSLLLRALWALLAGWARRLLRIG